MDILNNILGIGNNIRDFFSKKKKDLEDALQDYIPKQQSQPLKISQPQATPQKTQTFSFTPPKLSFNQPQPTVAKQPVQNPIQNNLTDFFKRTVEKAAQGASNIAVPVAKQIVTNTIPNAVADIANTVKQMPKNYDQFMHKGISGAIQAKPITVAGVPFTNAAQLEAIKKSNEEQAQKNMDLAIKLVKEGKTTQAQQLFEQNKKLFADTGVNLDNFQKQLEQGKKDVIEGGTKVIGDQAYLYGAKALFKPVAVATAGTIGAIIDKVSGGNDPYKAAGKTIAQLPTFETVNKVVSTGLGPVFKNIDKLNTPVVKQFISRTLSGLGNVTENELIAGLDKKDTTSEDKLLAFTLGALLSDGGKTSISDWNKLKTDAKDLVIEGGKKLGQDVRPAKDKWVLDPNDKWGDVPTFIYEKYKQWENSGFKAPVGLTVEDIRKTQKPIGILKSQANGQQNINDLIAKTKENLPGITEPNPATSTDIIRSADQYGNKELGKAQTGEMVARERFNIPQLKKIGAGSDRDVYDLTDGNVLKITKTSRGITQNNYSSDYYAEDVGLIPKTIEVGKNYVVKEKINPPDTNVKKMIKEIDGLGPLYGTREGWDNQDKAIQIMEKYGYPGEELRNYGDILWGDIRRIKNWGTKDGKPMLLDEGTLNGKLVTGNKVGGKNLQDPEFRDMYYQSRSAKKLFGDKDAQTMYGVAAGVEPYYDEKEKKWKFRFNSEKALLGMTVIGGVKAYKRGEITRVGKQLDELLGTTDSNMTGSWKNDMVARQTAWNKLEHEAETIPEAKTTLEKANKLAQQLQNLRDQKAEVAPKDIPTLSPTTKNIGGVEVKQPITEPQIQNRKSAEQIMQEVQSGTYQPRTKSVPTTENVVPPKVNVESQNLNVNKLRLSDEQKQEVAQIGIKDVKEKLTNKEIQDLAVKAGIDTKSYTIDQTANKIAEQLNVRRQVVEAEQALTELRKNGGTADQIEEAIRNVADKSRAAASQGTDIARQLQARKIIANEIDTPMQKIFKLLDNAGVNPDVYVKKAVNVDFNNAEQVTKFYRDLVPPKFSDWIDTIRYNSMLSSPNTHINNIASNFQGTGILTPIQKTIEGVIDSFANNGKRTRFAGEGLEYAKGYYSNIGKAWNSFTDVMAGKNEVLNPDTKNIRLATEGPAKKIEDTLRVTTNLLEGMDQFFTTLTEGGLKKSYAYRAEKLGKGKMNPSQITDEAQRMLYRGKLTNPDEGVLTNALGSVAKNLKNLTNSDNQLVRWTAKLTIPFINTGTNLAKKGVEHNPVLGAINLVGNEDKIAAVSKMIMGSAVMAASVPLATSGRITFGYPASKKEKDAFIAAGMQPYSIKIGDNWVSYAKMDPAIGFQLATVGGLTQAIQDKKITEDNASAIASGMSAGLSFILDQTYFKNVSDFMSAVKGGADNFTGGIAQLASNYPTQFIPFRAGISWLNRMIDEYQRTPDKDASFATQTFQNMASAIPGLAQLFVPVREDSKGNPVKNTNRFINAFSPFRVSTENPQEKMTYDLTVKQDKANREVTDLKNQAKSDLKKAGKQKTQELPEGMEGTLDNLYGVKALNEMSEDTNYQKARKATEAKKLINKVLDDDTVDEQTRLNYLGKKTGLSNDDLGYFSVARGTTEEKYAFIQDGISTLKNKNEVLGFLKESRKEVLGSMVLTDSVISDLVNDGSISKELGKQLKNFIYTEDGGKMKAGTGGLSKSKLNSMITKAKAYGKMFNFGKEVKIDSKVNSTISKKEGQKTQVATPKKTELNSDFFNTKVELPKAPSLESIIKTTRAKVNAPNLSKAKEIIEKARAGGNGTGSIKLSKSFFQGNRKS